MNMTTVPSNQLKAMQQEIADLKETIEQQAEAIEKLRDHIELSLEFCDEEGFCVRDNLENALAIQPSPEILQARDERVAKACMNSVTWECAIQISSGEWRKYL